MENQTDYITPIKDQLDKNMHTHCFWFTKIGSQSETPRFYNYGDYDAETKQIKIRSTQTDNLFFLVDIGNQSKEYIDDFMYGMDTVDDFWIQFKEYRTNFLKENYPTIKTK
jgi:hypothetical protein